MTQADGKANLSAAYSRAADRVLYNQTQGYYFKIFEGVSWIPTEASDGKTGSISSWYWI
jgi:hypothetical protein